MKDSQYGPSTITGGKMSELLTPSFSGQHRFLCNVTQTDSNPRPFRARVFGIRKGCVKFPSYSVLLTLSTLLFSNRLRHSRSDTLDMSSTCYTKTEVPVEVPRIGPDPGETTADRSREKRWDLMSRPVNVRGGGVWWKFDLICTRHRSSSNSPTRPQVRQNAGEGDRAQESLRRPGPVHLTSVPTTLPLSGNGDETPL